MLFAVPLFSEEPPHASISGRVVVADSPLPGATVTITSHAFTAQAVTNIDGAYQFDALAPDTYDLKFELSGLGPDRTTIDAKRGSNDAGIAKLTVLVSEEITLTCGSPCVPKPASRWERPACEEYNFNDALIQSLERGDRSAGELLARRYETTAAIPERHRIAGALAKNGHRSDAMWDDIAKHAANALRFRHQDESLTAYCAEQGCDADTYYYDTAWNAFDIAARDPRGRALMLEALETDDTGLIASAIIGLGEQHDESALPVIAKTLQRLIEVDHTLPLTLSRYKSAAADLIAFQYLNEDTRESYAEWRAEP